MHEPLVHFFGVKAINAAAGLIGGLVSLSFLKTLTPWQAIASVFTGAAVAGYGAPVVTSYLTLSPRAEYLCAFLLGLTAMNIIPAIIESSGKLRGNIAAIISSIRKDK